MIENINPTDKIIVDVSMYQIDMNPSKLQSLRREVANKYNVPLRNVIINQKPIMVDEEGKPISLTSDIITSIQDPKFQQNLFKEYIDLKKIENVDMDMILDIDNRVNAFVDFDSYSKYKSYKFKYVKWKNFLSYGDDNYIDFTKLHGLVLLCRRAVGHEGYAHFGRRRREDFAKNFFPSQAFSDREEILPFLMTERKRNENRFGRKTFFRFYFYFFI